MRHVLTFILFVLAVCGIGYVAVNPVSAGPVTEYLDVAHHIEGDLQGKANAALAEGGLEWAEVEMDGQIAFLRGRAPREEERAEAIALVRDSSGHGPWSRGGIMAVRDQSTLAPAASPFVWRAVRSGDRVTLSGHVPTRAARAELAAHAGELFPGGVADQMEVARGAPDEFAWSTVARTAVSQLAALSEGQATLSDVSLTIEGVAANARARNRVSEAIGNLPAPFLAAALVEALDTPEVPIDPLAEALRLEPITSIEACREQLAAGRASGAIEFAAGEPTLTKESYPVLDQLAITALRCEEMRFSVEAGGDLADGGEDYADLGLQRAQHIADYFVLKGVALDRMEVGAHVRSPETVVRRTTVFVGVDVIAEVGAEGVQ